MVDNSPAKLRRGPLRALARWTGFIHLLARFYMNYHAAVLRAARRTFRRAVDIDVHISKNGTLWALHWGTVGKNKLHDPLGLIGPHRLISSLTDVEIERLRGPKNQVPWKVLDLLEIAYKHNVRVELELKVVIPTETLRYLLSLKSVAKMNDRGKLQFKTLASMDGAVKRLAPAHAAGGVTILSFTGYRGPGISKRRAWPVTDYVRGRPKWAA